MKINPIKREGGVLLSDYFIDTEQEKVIQMALYVIKRDLLWASRN